MVITHRRNQLVLLLLVLVAWSPTTAEAGPLLDWLFQKNRSQTINANQAQTQTLQAQPSAYQTNKAVLAPAPRHAGTSCLSNLFGGNRNSLATAPLAGAPTAPAVNVYPQTANYAPQGGCASGWCQQTVVRWIPQTAYRTAYQQVPVTTYKTSTTINPANGLPLTCTRPCTTYTAQARRVPYTTYRPIYTTVPVADPLTPQQPAATTTGYAPLAPTSNYALQPPTSYAVPGCVNCQSGSTTAPATSYGSWSNVPGYTPGSATNLPPALSPTPWANTAPGASTTTAAPGATPWQAAPSSTGPYANGSVVGNSTAAPGPANATASPTDWRSLESRGATSPPSTNGPVPADAAPRLNRPVYPDDREINRSSQEDATMPKYLQERLSTGSQTQLVPRQPDTSYRYDTGDDPYSNRSTFGEHGDWDSASPTQNVPSGGSRLDDWYSERRADEYARSPSSVPDLQAPSNQRPSDGIQNSPIRGIPDRGQTRESEPASTEDTSFPDKTADQRRPWGTRPIIEEASYSRPRLTTAPTHWVNRPSGNSHTPSSDWAPVR